MRIEMRRPLPPHVPAFEARIEAMLIEKARRMRPRRRWLPRFHLGRRLRVVVPAALHAALILTVAVALVAPAGYLDIGPQRTTTTVPPAAQEEEPLTMVAAFELLDPRPGDFTRPPPSANTTTTFLRARPA